MAEWCPAARNRENVLAGDGITFHWPSADIDLMPRLRWRLVRRSGKNTVVLEAGSTPETMKAWPHPFRLQATITETNTGKKPYESSFMAEPRFADEAGCGVKVDGRQPTGKMPKAQPLAPGKSRKHGIRLSVVK